MPTSVSNDTENQWRTRYGLPPRAETSPPSSRRRALRAPRFIGSMRSGLHPRRRTGFLLFLVAAAAVGGGAWFVFADDDEATSFAASVSHAAAPAGDTAEVPPGYATRLHAFSDASEASLVALRGYLLTGSEGFMNEWVDATVRLQATADALEQASIAWTDGHRLVLLVEMKRIVAQLLAEQRTVAAIIGTENRYPGVQLFTQDIQPALREAQTICRDVLNAMLAVSSPEDARVIDPFARLRGDVEDLVVAVDVYIAAGHETRPPAVAGTAEMSRMIETLRNIRNDVPESNQAQIARLASLIETAREKLQRVFALRESGRWDYADYAFRTRIAPLDEKLGAIVAELETAS
jgi:CHASE3 domain sensor protein